jgi:hypothetical protein
MNQACIYMRKVGEAVKDGWQPIAAEAQNLRMAQVDFRFLLPEEVDALVDEAGSLYDRIMAHDPADHSCDYCSAAKPQRRAVALRFLRPGRTREARGHHAWLTPPRPAPHQS